MSGRGRGNSTSKRGGPNLALAGKREEGVSKTPAMRGKTPRGASRGGRGDSRGTRGGKFVRPDLITSEGIFSEGLHAEPASKRDKRDVDNITFARDSRNGIENREPIESEEQMEVDYGKTPSGYEDEWRSDTEEDLQALQEITGGVNFISDFKQGDRLPIVLPAKDEVQYHDLITKSNKSKLNGHDLEEKYSVGQELNPTKYLSRKAGKFLTKAFADGRSDSLLFLQLPTVINSLTSNVNDPTVKVEPNLGVPSPAAHSSGISRPDLPKGKKIGKLQITKRGRVVLKIGDTALDVTLAAPTELRENAILLETKADLSAVTHSMFGPTDTGSNAVYHVGKIEHHLIASADWRNLRTKPDVPPAPAPISPTKPNVHLLQEFRDLVLESTNWSEEAEKWASP